MMQPPRAPKPPTSASTKLRYRIARFKTLAKPQIWLPGLGMLGMLAFAWEFYQRPEWRQALLENPQNQPLDPEAREAEAIRADIDTLPLLNADIQAGKALKGTPEPSSADAARTLLNSKNKQPRNDDARLNLLSLEALLGGSPQANASKRSKLPALSLGKGSSLNSIGNAVNAPGLNASSGLAASPLTNPLSINSPGNSQLSQRPTTTSQLGNALNRYSPARPNPNAPFQVQPRQETQAPRQTTPAIRPIAGNAIIKPLNPAAPATTTPVPVTPVAGSNTVNPALLNGPQNGLNSYTSLTQGVVPSTSPTASVPSPSPVTSIRRTPTSVRIPSAPSTTVRRSRTPSFSVPRGSTPLQPGTVLSSPRTPTISSPAATRDIPFTAPRSIPGRRIGGGQIGTFSNP